MPDLLPHNKDAEQCVLGAMLRDNACIAEVVLALRPEDFYQAAHQRIFGVIVDLFDQRKAIDAVILSDELAKRQCWHDVGGAGYIAELWTSAPTTANVQFYVHIVREKSLLRRLIYAASETLHTAHNPSGPAEEIVEEAEKRILAISEMGVSGQARTLQSVLSDSLMSIEDQVLHKSARSVSTGFADLDEILCGFKDGDLILLAARPSCGKTALALSILIHVTTKLRFPSLFVSLEQSCVEIGVRMLCSFSKIDGQRIRQGVLHQPEIDALVDAAEELNKGGLLHIDDTPMQTVGRIAANARRLKRHHDIRLLVIDYLGLIEPDNKKVSRYEQVSAISRQLKCVARELKVPVLCLAQLNREVEGRSNNRPRLSDLRDSGNLEQDGDTILLLHKVESHGNVDVVNILIEKQRNGPTGEVPLAFCKPTVTFQNYAFGDNPYAW